MVQHKAQYSVFALARANNYLDRIKFQKFIKKLQSVDDNQNWIADSGMWIADSGMKPTLDELIISKEMKS